MKPKKSKKFLKQAKKLVKKIQKHGKDGEKLLLEVKKLLEASLTGSKNKKSAAKKSPAKKAAAKTAVSILKSGTNPPPSGNAPLA